MIKSEFKKNLINYKFLHIIVLFLMLTLCLQILKSTDIQKTWKTNDEYYIIMNGRLNEDKEQIMNDEASKFRSIDKSREKLFMQYKKGKILEKDYLVSIKKLNDYDEKRGIFNSQFEYVDYLKQDERRAYIDEPNIDQLFSLTSPYLLIAIVILLPIISYKNEDGFEHIASLTVNGNRKLWSSKMVVLMTINCATVLMHSTILFIFNYNFNRYRDLFQYVGSSRLFEYSFFSGTFIELLVLLVLLQGLGVILLTLINSKIMKTTNYDGSKLFVLEVGLIVFSLLFLREYKFIYYTPIIGILNPLRYFSGAAYQLETSFVFMGREFMLMIFITIVLLILLLIPFKKKIGIIVVTLLLGGCAPVERLKHQPMNYSNNLGISCNSIGCIEQGSEEFYDFKEKRSYQVNRNPILQSEQIITGYIYEDTYYFVSKEEKRWSLQAMNTKTFNQVEVYSNSTVDLDIFGNPKINKNEIPNQIYINKNDILFIYNDKVTVLEKSNKERSIIEERLNVIEIDNNNLYFINRESQLESINLKTLSRKVVLDDLVSQTAFKGKMIYYTRLQDDKIYRLNTESGKKDLLVNEPIYFFQLSSTSIVYLNENNSILKEYSIEENHVTIKLEKKDIYGFNIINDSIVVLIHDGSKGMTSLYVLNDGNLEALDNN